jgi:hypothetical protein
MSWQFGKAELQKFKVGELKGLFRAENHLTGLQKQPQAQK